MQSAMNPSPSKSKPIVKLEKNDHMLSLSAVAVQVQSQNQLNQQTYNNISTTTTTTTNDLPPLPPLPENLVSNPLDLLSVCFSTETERQELKQMKKNVKRESSQDAKRKEKNRRLAQESRQRKKQRQEQLESEHQIFKEECLRLYALYEVHPNHWIPPLRPKLTSYNRQLPVGAERVSEQDDEKTGGQTNEVPNLRIV